MIGKTLHNLRLDSFSYWRYHASRKGDDDKTLESESITNQKSLLLQYEKENHLRVYDIYIDKLNKKVTEEQFERVKLKLENELNIKQKRYNELNNNMNDAINEESKNKTTIEYINKFLSMEEPSRELIINLIDRVEIFEDKSINIKVCFMKN